MKRDLLFFLAGMEVFHTFAHATLVCSGLLPMRIGKLNVTQRLNRAAIVVNAAIAAGFLYEALKTEATKKTRAE